MADSIYIRTLVFSLVLTIACTASLGFLYLDSVRQYAWLLLTIEIGVLIVVISTIVSVYLYQLRMEEALKNSMDNLPIELCPDYWTKDRSGKCTNIYVTPDNRYKYMVGTVSVNKPVAVGRSLQEECRENSGSQYPWVYLRARCAANRI
jgi:hypothetical protein